MRAPWWLAREPESMALAVSVYPVILFYVIHSVLRVIFYVEVEKGV